MPVRSAISTKTLAEASVGELICFPSPAGSHGWGIVSSTDGRTCHVAVLMAGQLGWNDTSFGPMQGDTYCVGYGTDWVFEPLLKGKPVSAELRYGGGSWVAQEGEIGMILRDPKRETVEAASLNMRTIEYLEINRAHAVGGQHWRLWASETERADPRCEPLLVHPFAAEA